MFELLTRAIMEDRERAIERIALQNLAVRYARDSGPRLTGRRGWPFQRASRVSSAAFAPGHSASRSE